MKHEATADSLTQFETAVHLEAVVIGTWQDSHFVPRADPPQQNPCLFDDLVRGREQRRRYGEAEHSRGLSIDDQLELC